MMESPLYGGSYWNVPTQPRHRSHHSPSVREIPVHFVGSEQRPSRSDSAVKIQKLFRGFLVRKSVKKIAKIRSEVEEIDKRMSKNETIDLIARDSKERLKINEMLMNLLFRLDSVRGVDSGVRDFRKAVIKKAIALQEFLDAIVSSNSKNDQIIEEDAVDNVEKVVEAVDQNQTAEVEVECTKASENGDDSMSENIEAVNQSQTAEVDVECTKDGENRDESMSEMIEAVDQNQAAEMKVECTKDGENGDDSMSENIEAAEDREIVENQNGMEDKETVKCQIKETVESQIDDEIDREGYDAMPTMSDCPEESVGTSQTASQAGSSANPESLIEACEEDDSSSLKQENNAIEIDEAGNKEVDAKEISGTGDAYTRNRELLERMVEDNGRMMDLMAQLFERNEMQTRMLCSLSQRVEQLERAFLCERLRRKKKRQAAGIVDGCQT